MKPIYPLRYVLLENIATMLTEDEIQECPLVVIKVSSSDNLIDLDDSIIVNCNTDQLLTWDEFYDLEDKDEDYIMMCKLPNGTYQYFYDWDEEKNDWVLQVYFHNVNEYKRLKGRKL